jgi:cytoskeletal protein CcmA (bactofilin family)
VIDECDNSLNIVEEQGDRTVFDLNKKSPAAPTQKRTNAGGGQDSHADTQTASRDSQTGDMAVIGRSIKIEGDLRGEEDLRIEGTVSGSIHLPNHILTIGKNGRIKANVYAKSVVVDGEVNGDLYGSECVSIRANAHVECNVVATRVSLEEGARFKGSIDMDPERVKDLLGKKLGSRERASESGGKPRSTPAAALNTRAAEPGAAQRTASAKSSKAEPAH